MLRISEHWHGSDLGLQRQGNEDNYFVRAPLFVVADGMGGAQAGEVASEMAVESFTGGLPDGTAPGPGLRHIIEEANRHIHERSRTQSGRAGMGTTVTAAHVGENVVTIAHVGDSRCYVARDGELTRLTEDHSLVEELIKRGKLTPDQAETHPQRSVITRALGPEPDVQVDVFEERAQAGDLFLLCSDGLTAMVREPDLKPMLVGDDRPLADLGRSLIAAANANGGRDNITVILFRLEEVDAPVSSALDTPTEAYEIPEDDGEGDTSEYQTFAGEAVEPRQGVSRPTGHTRGTDAVRGRASDEAEAEYRASGTVALSAVRPRAQLIEDEEARTHAPPRRPAAPRRRGVRRLFSPGKLIAFGSLVGLLAAFWLATRQVYFVGVDDTRGNVVTLYHGLPYELPLGIELYQPVKHSGVTLQSVPARRRSTFTDHKLRSKDDAEGLVRALEEGRIS
ncbi:Stp1/IreP family PP2C-type Ser/Thr phosphatase [Solirubrobacter sp. CPCC 204708]|uniref:Stp1/IreP family PP2C-type Ser/Thr phosphatase n=1 Tax=Solirubrobacter deserti TaxID=2282478 RepID=A0ABT4RMM0_9ACTN|nr:Stp1/IreP family PP2C-type Ser/Thr phosphatase [Solirubrobacter deserti]MBE2316963.1 Stp1/IreP family PP2C-type Ser/Thr phosphatase [Solirubrobacter deserti]MDA0139794.1 Stp1/IreP family PP2C-type Ser/Thr phosphatase [Solirubrobacter deserti]